MWLDIDSSLQTNYSKWLDSSRDSTRPSHDSDSDSTRKILDDSDSTMSPGACDSDSKKMTRTHHCKSDHKSLETFEKINKNGTMKSATTTKTNQCENHLHSKTRLHDYHDRAANVANSEFYSSRVTARKPIATSYKNTLSFGNPIHKNNIACCALSIGKK